MARRLQTTAVHFANPHCERRCMISRGHAVFASDLHRADTLSSTTIDVDALSRVLGYG